MIQNLAHVAFRSPAADEWRSFATDCLGATLAADGPDGAVRVRIDDRPWRIEVAPGERDELALLGWDVAFDQFDPTVEAVRAAGCEVAESDALASERGASRAASFTGPFGLRHELVVDVVDGDPFSPADWMQGGFLTGDQGMGHVVLMLPSLDEGDRFVTDALGLVLSDTIEAGLSLRFYHCAGAAARHHSLAMSAVPGMAGLHHVMVEVTDLDDVGRAYDRCRDAGYAFAMDYGRHPNDQVTSFYVRTPSGFELEYGYGGVTIDDATWETTSYDATSLWGHRPPADGPLRPRVITRLETTGA